MNSVKVGNQKRTAKKVDVPNKVRKQLKAEKPTKEPVVKSEPQTEKPVLKTEPVIVDGNKTNPNQFLVIYYKNKVDNKFYKLFVRRNDKALNDACLYRFEGFDESTGVIKLLIEQAYDVAGNKCTDKRDVRYSIKFEDALISSQRIIEDLKLKNIELLDQGKIFVQKDKFIMPVNPNSIFGCSRYNKNRIFAKTDKVVA
jgi:hypothetical protein